MYFSRPKVRYFLNRVVQFGWVFHVKGTLDLFLSIQLFTHDLFLNILRDTVLSQLQRQHDNDNFFFQQVGAPLSYVVTVRKFLDEQLPNRWLDR